jgi:putative membrane protein insertion efficiency factor
MPERLSLLARLVRLPAQAVLGAIWLYQRTLSPVLPAVFGPACGCRFSPTCSHYAAEAVRTHGALRGIVLAGRRLVKCTPLHPGGFDPVPASPRLRRTGSPRCEAVPHSALGGDSGAS